MLNTNEQNVNFSEPPAFTGEISQTSFSNEVSSKYSFISSDGNIFNFGNMCDGRDFGNLLTRHNLEDAPDTDVKRYDTPFYHGGKIDNIRFTEHIFDVTFEIFTDNRESMEYEIRSIKKHFGSGKLRKVLNARTEEINVEVVDINFQNIAWQETQVTISLLSLDPFWSDVEMGSKVFRNETSAIDGSLNINDTGVDTYLDMTVQVIGATGDVDSFFIETDGYKVEVEESISEGDIIEFFGSEGVVKINSVAVDGYLGEFIPFPKGRIGTFKTGWTGSGNVTEHSVFILYSKLYK